MRILAGLAAGLALLPTTVRAQTDVHCIAQCYGYWSEPVVSYSSSEIIVAPPRIISETVPALHAVVPIPALIQPAHVIARPMPAERSLATERVLTSPAGRRWVTSYDYYGREIHGWEYAPNQFVTTQRVIDVRPADVHLQKIPALVELAPQRILDSAPIC